MFAMMLWGGNAAAESQCIAYAGYAITPPEKFVVSAQTHEEVTFTSPGETRHVSRISLFALEEEPLETYREVEMLPLDGLSLQFKTETVNVGSGGPEGFVIGKVRRDDRSVLGFDCSTQAEDRVDPLWCMESLRTLKRCEGDCGCKPAKAP
jgi:hypothetical protein